MKILIGVPCGETIKSRTAFSLCNLKKPEGTDIIFQMGVDIAHNRNNLAQMAIDGGYTHLLFVDADMIFSPDALERLLLVDKDIIGGAYNKRRLPRESTVSPIGSWDIGTLIPTELFKCKSIGTGFLLIQTRVFEQLEYPYFDFKYDGNKRYGEDVAFCELATQVGYDIWCDPTIGLGHIGDYQY